MARAPDLWRIACPRCRAGMLLVSHGGGIPDPGPTAAHECLACGLSIDEIVRALREHGLPVQRERSDYSGGTRAHYAAELARCEAQHGPNHLSTTRCLVALAIGFDRASDGAAARAYYRRAWAHLATTEAPAHPVWLELAAAFGYRLKCDGGPGLMEARACYCVLHDRYAALLGTVHPIVADACRVLANLSANLDDLEAARAWYEREIAIRIGVAGRRGANIPAPRDVAATTYCLHPIDREPVGGLDEHGYLILTACALLAVVLERLGDPAPAHVLDRLDLVDSRARARHAVIAGDFLGQRHKSFAVAAAFYDYALSLMPEDRADTERLSIAAKLQMARTFMAHGMR